MKVTDPILQIFWNCLYAVKKKYNDKCFLTHHSTIKVLMETWYLKFTEI